MSKTKIVIVGTGGVGGFIGGKLASYYLGSPFVEVDFLSRGEALKRIIRSGLQVDAQQGSFTAFPNMATNRAESIGEADFLLLCTKAYDVDQVIEQIRPMVGPRTVILPFLNGVDSTEKLRRAWPDRAVWDGCVYIVAYMVEPGHIVERTNGYRYFFGSRDDKDARLSELERLFSDASIQATHQADIERRVWDKLAFISTVATATSYTDKTYGEVLSDALMRADFDGLLSEFCAVAQARGVQLSEGIGQKIVAQMERIPADTTTSMQRDFRAGRPTELESLTGYVVREAHRLGVATPIYDRMYAALLERMPR